MQLHIRHETTYSYQEPAKRSIQSLRLTPRREPHQRTVHWHISAPGRPQSQVDAYGNVVHLLSIEQPHREIRIVAYGVVETDDANAALLQDEGRLSPLAYLAQTRLTLADETMKEWALVHGLRAPGGNAQRFIDFSEVIRGAVQYQPGVTEVHDAASDVVTRGRGVCQDHAHVFLACCRAAGVPARYVSGYLYTDAAGHVASHAWVDVWISEERAWASIDVTHGALVGGQHCRLAVGRDYMDACPIRGVRQGGSEERMQANVLVATSAQQQQQQ